MRSYRKPTINHVERQDYRDIFVESSDTTGCTVSAPIECDNEDLVTKKEGYAYFSKIYKDEAASKREASLYTELSKGKYKIDDILHEFAGTCVTDRDSILMKPLRCPSIQSSLKSKVIAQNKFGNIGDPITFFDEDNYTFEDLIKVFQPIVDGLVKLDSAGYVHQNLSMRTLNYLENEHNFRLFITDFGKCIKKPYVFTIDNLVTMREDDVHHPPEYTLYAIMCDELLKSKSTFDIAKFQTHVVSSNTKNKSGRTRNAQQDEQIVLGRDESRPDNNECLCLLKNYIKFHHDVVARLQEVFESFGNDALSIETYKALQQFDWWCDSRVEQVSKMCLGMDKDVVNAKDGVLYEVTSMTDVSDHFSKTASKADVYALGITLMEMISESSDMTDELSRNKLGRYEDIYRNLFELCHRMTDFNPCTRITMLDAANEIISIVEAFNRPRDKDEPKQTITPKYIEEKIKATNDFPERFHPNLSQILRPYLRNLQSIFT